MFDVMWGQDDWFSWDEYLEVYGLEEKIKINLDPDDLCVVLTLDGQFGGIWSHTHRECLENGDAIHDWMVATMKEGDNNKGCWLWHIRKDLKSAIGEHIGELE